MVAVSDADVSGVSLDAGEAVTYLKVTVTGRSLTTFDGMPLTGAVIFTPSQVVSIPGLVILDGSATAEVVNGAFTQPLVLPATDCVSPAFTYTITPRLQTPDGNTGPPPVAGVSVPHTLGTVDISVLW